MVFFGFRVCFKFNVKLLIFGIWVKILLLIIKLVCWFFVESDCFKFFLKNFFKIVIFSFFVVVVVLVVGLMFR